MRLFAFNGKINPQSKEYLMPAEAIIISSSLGSSGLKTVLLKAQLLMFSRWMYLLKNLLALPDNTEQNGLITFI